MRNAATALFAFIALALIAQPVNAFWIPAIIRIPIWSNCRWGLFFFWPYAVCSNNGGQAANPAAPTPAPLVCDTATQYAWNGVCKTRLGLCETGADTQIVASPNAPCTCAPPGTLAVAPKVNCNNPTNGSAFCRTNADGGGSVCGVKCDGGYVERNGICLKDKLGPLDCPGQRVGTTAFGQGCKCVPTTSAGGAVYPDQACPNMVVPPPVPPAPFGNPNGVMTCIPAADGTGKCVQQCTSPAKPLGAAICAP